MIFKKCKGGCGAMVNKEICTDCELASTVNSGLIKTDIIYRIQDQDGRGPFKPGFSHKWVSERRDHENLRSWLEEFGPVHNQLLVGEHCGCGCKSLDQLRRWFTKSEYKKLRKFGYRAVKLNPGRIIAESDTQCVFGRATPLHKGAENVRLY